MDGLLQVAQLLLEKEVLSRDDMIELLGKRAFKEKREFVLFCFLLAACCSSLSA